jgi:hypothetical protein
MNNAKLIQQICTDLVGEQRHSMSRTPLIRPVLQAWEQLAGTLAATARIHRLASTPVH